ncbi:hypothetical protein [Siccibacter turicensis]
MTEDSLLIAKAILELKQGPDIVKDYVFPISISFLSALLGGMTAYWFNLRQERVKYEKEKFFLANKLVTTIIECSNGLVSIKVNYISLNSTNPLKRALSIPYIINAESNADFDMALYSFIKNIPTCNLGFLARLKKFIKYRILGMSYSGPSDEEVGKSWRNINRVSACIKNYNLLITLLSKRNELDEEVKLALKKYVNERSHAAFEITPEEAMSNIPRSILVPYIGLTETIIALNDHLIKETDSFLNEFPSIVESNIELSLVGKGSKVLSIKNAKPGYIRVMNPIVKPDYNLLAKLMGLTHDEVIKMYTYSDWY